MTKRQFLKVALGGAAGLMIGRALKPASLLASPVVIPHTYLDSAVHNQWMRLSHHRGGESRQTRRNLGAALRNLGSLSGGGLGREFALCFDEAVETVYRRYRQTNQKPGGLFALVQALYDQSLARAMGEAGGWALFGRLLSVLRGQDGTAQGELTHQSYLLYRQLLLRHKALARTSPNSKETLDVRNRRSLALRDFQQKLQGQIGLYARRQLLLNPNFRVQTSMLEGFEIQIDPTHVAHPSLAITADPGRMVVSWKGEARLQEAPTARGPWKDARKSSPAGFVPQPGHQFFRTVQEQP